MSSKPNVQRFMVVYEAPELTSEESSGQRVGLEFGLTRSGLRLQVPNKLPLAVVGQKYSASLATTVSLPKGDTFFWILATTETDDWQEGEREGALAMDRFATQLALVYGRDLFHTVAFRGTILQPKGSSTVFPGQIKVVKPTRLPLAEINTTVADLSDTLEADSRFDSYSLVAHFYQRAMREHVLEMKFLFLWFALEVFPLKGSSHLRIINDFVSSRILGGADRDVVARGLELGRVYGMRAHLVHHGRWMQPRDALSSSTAKLEDVVWEIMRSMCGLAYSGRLDQYL